MLEAQNKIRYCKRDVFNDCDNVGFRLFRRWGYHLKRWWTVFCRGVEVWQIHWNW